MTQYAGYFSREVLIFGRVKKRKQIRLNPWYLPDKVRGITTQETRNLATL